MKKSFYVACECGGTGVTNYVEVDEYGNGEMITACLSCAQVTSITSLCEDVVHVMLEELETVEV